MPWWVLLLIQVGFSIVTGLLQSRNQSKPEKKIEMPETDASAAIPVVWGTCLITGAQLLDYFDFKATAIKIRNPTTLFLTKLTIGYRYFLGMVFGLCWSGGDEMSEIDLLGVYIDNRAVWEGSLTTVIDGRKDIYINKPTHFGAQKQEGGVAATLTVHTGDQADAYWYWEDQREMSMPHYQDLAYVVWNGPSWGVVPAIPLTLSGYIGNAPRVWPISFKVRRLPIMGLVPGEVAEIQGQANPILCLYECLVNKSWGAGMNAAHIDASPSNLNTSFVAAAYQCWGEDLGFAYQWNTASPVEEMVAEILRHVEGVIWTDLRSGKIMIKLVRAETTTVEVNNSDFLEIKSFSRGSWRDTRNELRLTFPDQSKVNFENSTYPWFDDANFQTQGATEPAQVTYRGCYSMELAGRLAARDGRVFATPLAKLSAVGDRQFWDWYPGMLFKFTDPTEGISQLPMRVTSVDLGTILDGKITINAVQDVFRAGDATFGAPDSTVWTDPLEVAAEDAPHGAVGEIPYWMQRDNTPRVFGMASRPSAAHLAYDGSLNGAAGDPLDVDFTPTGTLAAKLEQLADGGFNTSGFTVENVAIDADQIEDGSATSIAAEGEGLALIGNPAGAHEWIAFQTFTDNEDGTVTINDVWRGLLDTPPREWPAGSRVWFFSVSQAVFMTGLGNSQAITFEALTRTMRDQLTNSEATNYSYTTQRRAFRPLPPYFVRLGGSYTDLQQDSGDVELAWREHSRLVMTSIIKQSEATSAAEAGVTYEIDIYATDGTTLLRAVTGLTDPDYTYTNADELSDSGASELQARLLFKIYSKRDGLRSLYAWERYVYRLDPAEFENLMVEDGIQMIEDGELMVEN